MYTKLCMHSLAYIHSSALCCDDGTPVCMCENDIIVARPFKLLQWANPEGGADKDGSAW